MAPQDRIRALRAELAELHARLEKERQHFAQVAPDLASGGGSLTLQVRHLPSSEFNVGARLAYCLVLIAGVLAEHSADHGYQDRDLQ